MKILSVPEHLRRRKPRSRPADDLPTSKTELVDHLLGPGAGDPIEGHNLISKADMVAELLDEKGHRQ
ncbi:hypothetical protein QEN35_13000 [Gordonia alkanivorans]|uniref:hypothetical protein n=1 Tax=Gordonia TaxID=2053 RepID=UPI0012BB37DA|nr:MULTISPECIES: hypothetical protein [Gordonia]MDH3025304.1 hypothetical protein [Gordonia alkanivorans]QGP87291.1 hypothetical protein GKZ92_06330 [Gordonia sp. 135]